MMVSPTRASATCLMLATTKPTSPAVSSSSTTGFGRERAEAFHFVDLFVGAQANFLVHGEAALHHAHQNHGAAIGSNQESKISACSGASTEPFGGGTARDDGFEDLLDAQAALGADHQRVGGGNGQHVFDLRFHFFGLRGGQIDFVDHRDDGEVVLRGEERIGDGLRFDALAGVDDEQGAFAGRKGARDFVGKIHVAGRVDEVELVFLAVLGAVMQANALGLDGDAALALEVHRIEDLRGHLALGERAGQLEQAVGQGGFAVVDVRDDAEVAYETRVHVFWLFLVLAVPSGGGRAREKRHTLGNISVCHK